MDRMGKKNMGDRRMQSGGNGWWNFAKPIKGGNGEIRELIGFSIFLRIEIVQSVCSISSHLDSLAKHNSASFRWFQANGWVETFDIQWVGVKIIPEAECKEWSSCFSPSGYVNRHLLHIVFVPMERGSERNEPPLISYTNRDLNRNNDPNPSLPDTLLKATNSFGCITFLLWESISDRSNPIFMSWGKNGHNSKGVLLPPRSLFSCYVHFRGLLVSIRT